MKITIKTADNGWILNAPSDDPELSDRIYVYETPSGWVEDELRKGEVEALVKLLYDVAESVGYTYEKWGKYNLNISIVKGHKIDDEGEEGGV